MIVFICLNIRVCSVRVGLTRHPVALQVDRFDRANAVGIVFHDFAYIGPTAKVKLYLGDVHARCLNALGEHFGHFDIGWLECAAELLKTGFEWAPVEGISEVLVKLDVSSLLNKAVSGGSDNLMIDV